MCSQGMLNNGRKGLQQDDVWREQVPIHTTCGGCAPRPPERAYAHTASHDAGFTHTLEEMNTREKGKDMKRATAEQDSQRAYRNDKSCFSALLPQKTADKLTMISTATGCGPRKICLALMRGDSLTTYIDEVAIANLGKGIGLLKLAAVTFAPAVKLDINTPLHRIEKIRRELIHGQKAITRTPNREPEERGSRHGRKISFYLTAHERRQFETASKEAGFASAGAYIRSLIHRKEITSRLSYKLVNEIREAGAIVRAVIAVEEQRDKTSGEPAFDIQNVIKKYDALLQIVEQELKK